ncbi:MAG: hypothetical protein KME46_34120 [Brasilonema angustatum HA4187-MV1]|jgi:hypothetical protein|nr:hypothetical protein [Brasilonema angustatum HA4187-MV1]
MSQHFSNLSERFGSDLENLNREQKMLLIITLTTYMWKQEHVGFSSSLAEVWDEPLAHSREILEMSWTWDKEEFEECLKILEGISIEDAGLIVRRLLEQCLVGNAKKLEHEEFTDALIAKGFPEELAKKAAYADRIACLHRGLTPEERELIGKARDLLNE